MTSTSFRPGPWTRAFLVGVTYLVAALLGVWLTRVGGNVAALWPPNAILLGILLRRPDPLWPLPIATCALVNLGLNLAMGDGVTVSIGFTVANMLEVLAAFGSMRVLVGSTVRLRSLAELLALLIGPVLMAPAVGATVGAAMVDHAFAVPFTQVWHTWWTGDAVGMALIAPLVLSWPGAHPAFGPGATRGERWFAVLEFFAVSVLLAALILFVVVRRDHGSPGIFVPVLMWSALRFGVSVTAAFSLTITLVATGANILGVWPLPFDAGPTLAERVWPLQLSLLLMSFPPLLVAVVSRERAVAQAALAMSERRFNWAVEAVGDDVWEIHVPTGELTGRDGRARMLGYAEERSAQRLDAIDPFVHPDDLDQVRTARQDHLAGRTEGYAVEFRCRHRDGRWRWLQSRGRVMERDHVGRPLRMSGIVTDVTERKRLEAEAKESEAFYRTLIATFPDAVFVQQGGTILFSNQSAARLLRASDPEALRGLPLCGFYDQAVVPHALERARQALAGAVLPPWQTRLRCMDGHMAEVETIACGITLHGQPAHLVIVRDITERQRLMLELEEGRQALSAVIKNMGDGLVVADGRGLVQIFNPAAEHIFGYTSVEVIGQDIGLLMATPDRDAHHDHVQRQLRTGEQRIVVGRTVDGRRKSGEVFPLELTITELPGESHRFVATLRDITRRRQLERELERLALHDALTGLPNRVAFMAELARVRARTLREGGRLAVLMIDLDRFKPINDTYGHAAGDALLVEMARRLEDCVREGDFVARLGGDEFAALAATRTDPVDFGLLAQRIVTELARPWQHDGHHLQPGGSVGLTVFPDDKSEAEGLLLHADRALYRAKERRRGGWAAHGDADEPHRPHLHLVQAPHHDT